MERVIFHIDMNSYFASASSQANPFLRGRAIGIGGKPGSRGIIAAASIEAKRRGVKTAMNAYEALKICPDLKIVDGDPDSYADISRHFVQIFRRYTDTVEVFSIDEAFLDVTGWHERWGGPEKLAGRIKSDMRRDLGDCLTCSIGIAPNKILAKLASDLKKPNGLVRISREDAIVFLAFSELTDVYGIAGRMRRRLRALRIRNLLELRAADLSRLISAFGPVVGVKLWLIGQGEDLSPVTASESAAKSFGNSYTLPEDTDNQKTLYRTLLKLAEKVCYRLRQSGQRAKTLSAYARRHDLSYDGGRTRLAKPTSDPLVVIKNAWDLIKPRIDGVLVRLLGIELTDLVPTREQNSLWPDCDRRSRVNKTVDEINNSYGPNTV